MKWLKFAIGSALFILLLLAINQERIVLAIMERTLDENLTNATLENELSNGDAMFWLFQGGKTNRYQPNSVYYEFDQPLDPDLLLERIQELTGQYKMLQRNVVMVDDIPYWQTAHADWQVNFKILNENDDMEALRIEADHAISQNSEIGEGLPLFRAYLSADHRRFVYIWHHALSDFEGMFNKHAVHLFKLDQARTQYGYQVRSEDEPNAEENSIPSDIKLFKNSERSIGFEFADFDVSKFILPIQEDALAELGQQAQLPMSDIFSLITLRAITRYHQDNPEPIRPIISPVSLRTSALDLGEGNNRAVRQFPVTFPLESVQDMYQRVVETEPTSSSYDMVGWVLKLGQSFTFVRNFFLTQGSPDYISNYFPLADMSLSLGEAKLTGHFLRVPMVPYEQTKFAWSNYNGEVQLFMHTDPNLIDQDKMVAAYESSLRDVLGLLESIGQAD